jgi:hypothetical protein
MPIAFIFLSPFHEGAVAQRTVDWNRWFASGVLPSRPLISQFPWKGPLPSDEETLNF